MSLGARAPRPLKKKPHSLLVAFASLIVVYVGGWLMDRVNLLGGALAVGVALVFMRHPI